MDDNALQMAAEPKQLQELNWASTTKDEQKGRTKMKKPGVGIVFSAHLQLNE